MNNTTKTLPLSVCVCVCMYVCTYLIKLGDKGMLHPVRHHLPQEDEETDPTHVPQNLAGGRGAVVVVAGLFCVCVCVCVCVCLCVCWRVGGCECVSGVGEERE